MKNLFLLIPITTLLFFASCKKETTQNPVADLYEENLKLVDTSSAHYLVADIEGIDGVDKIIFQSGLNNFSYSSWHTCQSVYEIYYFGFSNNQYRSFDFYLGDGEPDSDYYFPRNEVKPFVLTESAMNGVEIKLQTLNYETFSTYEADEANNENAGNSFEKIYRIGRMTGKFNCVLQNAAHTKKIYLKNAVCKL